MSWISRRAPDGEVQFRAQFAKRPAAWIELTLCSQLWWLKERHVCMRALRASFIIILAASWSQAGAEMTRYMRSNCNLHFSEAVCHHAANQRLAPTSIICMSAIWLSMSAWKCVLDFKLNGSFNQIVIRHTLLRQY